ncbi:MAG: type IX secretion system protein PorQ [Bacteroidales bacterium]|jgi:hypothetical protein|nr:type IX secretion system protein PorQ [Bacteroidales bacterium]
MRIVKLLRNILILFCLLFPSWSKAQTGGKTDFDFLTLIGSARTAALGSNWLPIKDGDINVALMNPSLISKDIHKSFGLNYINGAGGINYGYAVYSHTFEKAGSFTGAFQFINYGTMREANETGEIHGDFSANELALNIGWGRVLTPRWSIGANVKLAYSSMYPDYNAAGIGVDVAGSYYIPDENMTLSLVANNIGYVFAPYSSGKDGPFPFSLSFGMSQKLKHIPFRYIIVYNHIEKWNLRGNSKPTMTVDPILGDTTMMKGEKKFADNLMRHLTFGAELTIAKVVNLRASYNYGKRQELMTETKKGMVGFSWGVGLSFKRFSIDYARTVSHLAASPNYFTFSANIDRLIAKRTSRMPRSADED